jgi:hypothetical protein
MLRHQLAELRREIVTDSADHPCTPNGGLN